MGTSAAKRRQRKRKNGKKKQHWGSTRDPKTSKKWPPGPRELPPGGQNGPQERPRRPQESPGLRAAHEPPGAPQAYPRASQIRLPSGLDHQMGPTWRPRALRKPPRGHLGPSLGRFATPRGAIFTYFSTFRTAFAKLSFTQSLCKHTVSIARRLCLISTSLCNFCMLISTATDSRSRSTNQCIAA